MTKLLDNIKKVETDKLIEYGKNPKKHPAKQIDKLASSIKEYGFDQPIVVDKDNQIIKGHGRLKASKKLGLEFVPVIKREDLTDAQIKGARIMDNKSSESNWDMELLEVELEELDDINDFDLEDTGFDELEIESMLQTDEDFSFDIDKSDDSQTDNPVDDRETEPDSNPLEDTPDDMEMVQGEEPNKSYVATISFSSIEQAQYFLENINKEDIANRYQGNVRNVSIDGDTIQF